MKPEQDELDLLEDLLDHKGWPLFFSDLELQRGEYIDRAVDRDGTDYDKGVCFGLQLASTTLPRMIERRMAQMERKR